MKAIICLLPLLITVYADVIDADSTTFLKQLFVAEDIQSGTDVPGCVPQGTVTFKSLDGVNSGIYADSWYGSLCSDFFGTNDKYFITNVNYSSSANDLSGSYFKVYSENSQAGINGYFVDIRFDTYDNNSQWITADLAFDYVQYGSGGDTCGIFITRYPKYNTVLTVTIGTLLTFIACLVL